MNENQEFQERRWIALILLCFAQIIVVLDVSIVNVALPSIGEELNFSQENLAWVVNGYVLTFGGFLLLGGRMADLLGRRRVFIAGLIVVAVASLVAGFATNQGQLIAARAAQGLGAAIISPSALSIVSTIFRDGAERNKALAAWGAVSGMAGAAGVLLGGILTDSLGWEWVLWVNVPVALLAAALAPRLIQESHANLEHRHFDVWGAVTVTAGLSLLIYALVHAESSGWTSATTFGLLAGAIALIAIFVTIETRSHAPLVPFGIFRLSTLRGANIVAVFLAASLFSMFFFITLYMQQVLGFTPIEAGLSYLPLAVTIIIVAGAVSPMVTKLGYKPVLAAGLALTAIGLLWFSQISVDGSFLADILGPSLVAAAGLGCAFVSVTIAAMAGTRDDQAGLASGLINTSQQLGGALGLAILATVATSRIDDLLATDTPAPVALTEGFQNAFLVGAGLAVVGAILTLVLIRTADSRAHVALGDQLDEQLDEQPVEA